MCKSAIRRAWRGMFAGLVLVLAGTASASAATVAVYPMPGSRLATARTEIAFRGIAPSRLGAISVVGSRSGVHSGRIAADSDGRGASFIPTTPFTYGERVRVKTFLNILRGSGGAFSFTVETPAGQIPAPPVRYSTPRVRGDVHRYHSAPNLAPSAMKIDHSDRHVHDIFLTPMRGPLEFGPLIIDHTGQPVWFNPLPGPTTLGSDFRVQRYMHRNVLTWWQGYVNFGVGEGEDVIYDSRYRPLRVVQAGNGLKADLHEFTITGHQTALITSYSLVRWDSRKAHADRDQRVMNCTVQEIDIRTGRVLFSWDSLDHIPVQDTYKDLPSSKNFPFDYFHVNSVQRDFDGNLIISARNTWAVYKINVRTGAVIWSLGGKHSSFKMGKGTDTAFQHHATVHSGGVITIFDDGAIPQVHKQSRGIVERINRRTHKVTLLRELDHTPKLVAPFEGSVQLLSNRHLFVGWGAAPYFTEYDSGGHEVFDGRIIGANSSYRAYEIPWHATPTYPPAVAAGPGKKGRINVYASWNGATDVAYWQVLAGASPTSLSLVTTAKRSGFETWIPIRTSQKYIAVRALNAKHHALGTSSAVTS